MNEFPVCVFSQMFVQKHSSSFLSARAWLSLLLRWIEARIALRGARAVWFRVEPLDAFLGVSSRVSGAIRAPGVSRADPGPPSSRPPGVSFF
jgi:hypothetical protein